MSTNYVTSGQARHLRACMVCSIVRLQTQFVREGCPNCEDYLPSDYKLAGNPEAVGECTSQVFEGLLNLADPASSWVARWQRLERYIPGMYAIKVVGNLPEGVIPALEDVGVKYVPRDGSVGEDE